MTTNQNFLFTGPLSPEGSNVQLTSLEAYSEVLQNLGERQASVYLAIKGLKSATNLMISTALGLPINSVTPRTLELRKMGFVEVDKIEKDPQTKRKSIFWRVK